MRKKGLGVHSSSPLVINFSECTKLKYEVSFLKGPATFLGHSISIGPGKYYVKKKKKHLNHKIFLSSSNVQHQAIHF